MEYIIFINRKTTRTLSTSHLDLSFFINQIDITGPQSFQKLCLITLKFFYSARAFVCFQIKKASSNYFIDKD